MEPLTLEITPAEAAADAPDGAQQVRAAGEIDMSSAGQLSTFLGELVEGGASTLVLDASAVTFIDSTGLRVLVDIGSRLETRGGALVIDPMSTSVHRVLEITGLLERYGAS